MMKRTTISTILLAVFLAMGNMACAIDQGGGTATAAGWMFEDYDSRVPRETALLVADTGSSERLQTKGQEPEQQDTISREVSQLVANQDGAEPKAQGVPDPKAQQAPDAEKSAKQKDNTGTNPVNFTYDFRLYTEMAQLNQKGGSLITNTAEFRLPLGRDIANLQGAGPGSLFYDMGNMFQLRFKARYQNLSVDNPDSDPFGSSEVSGIGDFDARVLAIAYASKSFILAPGLEAFFDTASNDALGSGKTSLAPVIFGVFPGILGGKSLFAPGYQYVFDIAGDSERSDISRSQIDLYFVWQLAEGRNWLIVDPQIILDHENNKEAMTVEAEWGFMIAPKQGFSGYLRPGFGIGANRPYSWNLEIGIKFVWR